MPTLKIGARISEEGFTFFGIDEVNKAIAGGAKVTRIEEGEVLVEEVPEEYREPDDEAGYSLAGFEIAVTLESGATIAATP